MASADGTQRPNEVAGLVRRSAEANVAWVNGDMDRYLTLIQHSDDYTLLAPFGGAPIRGFDTSPDRLAELKRFFERGSAELELVEAYASGDLVVLVMIERQQLAVGGLPAQDWSLRVTQVFRRKGSTWQLVHRHADPLVGRIGFELAAAIARGVRAP